MLPGGSFASNSQQPPWRSMPMLSLEERIDLLESDLKAVPMRISVYHDLPFAILHYEPEKEWELRRQAKQLKIRLEQMGTERKEIPLAARLGQGIKETHGSQAAIELE